METQSNGFRYQHKCLCQKLFEYMSRQMQQLYFIYFLFQCTTFVGKIVVTKTFIDDIFRNIKITLEFVIVSVKMYSLEIPAFATNCRSARRVKHIKN